MSEPVAFVFPGQGSQAVGMGADVYRASPAARAVFALADSAVGFPLSQLCFEGPEERLRETINTQPAIVATSLALLAALQEAAGATPERDAAPPLSSPLRPTFVAGHSVGEYAALSAAGALDIAATLRLVRERGRLMHEAGQACPSGMAAVLGLDVPTLQAVCTEAMQRAQTDIAAETATSAISATSATPATDAHPGDGQVVVANDNAPGQVVISGAQRTLEIAMDLARERGAKRVVPLAVSGAFHSPVMAPASAGLAEAVEVAPIHDAAIPIISNITAAPLTAAQDVRAELARQIASPVQWTRTIEYLVGQGVTTFVEVGAGQVLAGLIKRIARGAVTLALGSASDLAPVADQLRERLAE